MCISVYYHVAPGVSSAHRPPAADAVRRRDPARASCSHLAASDSGAGEPAALACAAGQLLVREGRLALALTFRLRPGRRRRYRFWCGRERERDLVFVRVCSVRRHAHAAVSGPRASRRVRDRRGRRALGGAAERAADRARPDAHAALQRVLRAALRHRHRASAPRPARRLLAVP